MDTFWVVFAVLHIVSVFLCLIVVFSSTKYIAKFRLGNSKRELLFGLHLVYYVNVIYLVGILGLTLILVGLFLELT